jgi:hypothetical protein
MDYSLGLIIRQNSAHPVSKENDIKPKGIVRTNSHLGNFINPTPNFYSLRPKWKF